MAGRGSKSKVAGVAIVCVVAALLCVSGAAYALSGSTPQPHVNAGPPTTIVEGKNLTYDLTTTIPPSGGHHGSSKKSGKKSTASTTPTTISQSIPGDPNDALCATGIPAPGGGQVMAGCDLLVPTNSFVPTPTVPPAVLPRVPPVAVQQQVIDYAKTLTMPTPAPKMSAPQGICGVVHGVDLQIPAVADFPTEATPFGDLTATATGSFRVNWGDGTSNTYAVTGGPGPNSSINHFWTNAGTYAITVTATWTVNWQLGDYTGSTAGPVSTATLPNWQVIQAQAVIVS